MTTLPNLTLSDLDDAVRSAVALRAVLRLQPAAGPGAKVFPPTYVKDNDSDHGQTRYATEKRRIDGADRACVLLDSVASQANRMELALLDAWLDGATFPVVRVDFSSVDEKLEAPIGSISSLEAPHRIYDAILRDSVDADGTLFRYTAVGEAITHASLRDATALYRYCPTALIFGAWDSTGPKGGLGSKFARAISSEIVAVGIETGTRVGGRLDPLRIVKSAGPVYDVGGAEGWAFDKVAKAKEKNPSDINHGNIAPTRSTETGGVTFDYAQQTTVLSLPALRRLKFATRVGGEPHTDRKAAHHAAQVALAALALLGLTGAYQEGHDLRSGALLVGEGPLVLEIVGPRGGEPSQHHLDADGALALLEAAVGRAASLGMGWEREPFDALRPADKLVALLARSQALEAQERPEAGA